MFRSLQEYTEANIWFVNDKNILMRFDHWLPEELTNEAIDTITMSFTECLNESNVSLVCMAERIYSTDRFDSIFLRKLCIILIKQMMRNQEENTENLKSFEKLYKKRISSRSRGIF